MNGNSWLIRATVSLALAIPALSAFANPSFEMVRHSVHGGGTMRSTAGNLELSGTIGQPVAGVLSADGLELSGGFWFSLPPTDCDDDGSVGYLDLRLFAACVTGPARAVSQTCHCLDVVPSDTVDLHDFAALQREFNNQTVPPGYPDETTVTGVVQLADPAGDPVAGATVELVGLNLTTLSESDGSFVFLNVTMGPGIIDVLATATVNGEELFGAARFVKALGARTTDVGVITLSDIVRWAWPDDGLWSVDKNWEAFFPPGPARSVVIDVPDVELTVTYDNTVPFTGPIGDLLCNERLRLGFFNSLSVAGTFQMNNVLEMEFGELVDTTVDLGPGGLINMLRGSTLDGVTINGNMDLVGNTTAVGVRNGLTINGEVRMPGLNTTTGSRMFFEGPGKFIDGNATISFISGGLRYGATIHQNDSGNLHIRSGVTIRGTAGVVGQDAAPLVHDGLIHSDVTGPIHVRGLDWVNNGTLRVTGQNSELFTHGSWINNGAVEASSEGTLVLGDDWQNLGTLSATDAVVRLHLDFTIAELGTFDFVNSQVIIEGTFSNDTDLVVDANRFHWSLGGGTVLGGTISSADGTTFDIARNLVSRFHTLDGVTLNADMRYVDRPGPVLVRNGLKLNGTISMLNNSDRLSVDAPNRIIDGTGRIEFLRHFPDFNSVVQADTRGADDLGVMTIGPGITIAGANGRVGYDSTAFGAPVSLINQGTIQAVDHLGTLTLYGDDWINEGLLESFSNGGVMDAVGNWTNNGTIHVKGSFNARDTWTNNGTVHVEGGDFSANETWLNNGTLRIEPVSFAESLVDFTQSATGTYAVGIRSTAPEGHGLMIVSGTAKLDGVLRLEFEDTFTPAVGQSFAVLQYGDHIGEFATIETVGLDPTLNVVATYNPTFLTVSIEPN